MHKPRETSNRVFLIDASIYFFRAYFSMPENWVSLSGYSTSATMGYYGWLSRFLKAHNPRYVAACFDESLQTGFRHQIYPDYKSGRALPDEGVIYEQILCQKFTQALGVSYYVSSKYEADDLIATLAYRARKKKLAVTIVSADKDLAQCVLNEQDHILDFPKNEPLDRNRLLAKMGMRPEQVPSFLALVGDVSDNIPGVPGIGEKTAIELLARYDDVFHLLKNAHEIGNMQLRRAKFFSSQLAAYHDQILMAHTLATVVKNAELNKRFNLVRRKTCLDQLDALKVAAGFKTI